MKELMTVALFGALALTAQTGPIVQYLDGTFSYAPFFNPGESFTTPAGGPWSSISFNFYSGVGAPPYTTPVAPGTAFLLSTAYAGTPEALSAATPGFIASSISNAGGIYTFDRAVTLQPNTQYWIFANTAGVRFSGSTTAGTSAQTLYVGKSNEPFLSVSGQVANFTLSGEVALFLRTLGDISTALASGGIDNQDIASSLTEKITNAKNAPNKKTSNNIINAFIHEVNAQTGKHISTAAAALLIGDAIALLGLP